MGVELAIRVAVVLGVVALGALARRIPFFRVASGRFTQQDLPELTKRYAKWEMLAIVPLFATAGFFGWLSYRVMVSFADWYHTLGEPPLFQRVIPHEVWMIPAIFIGILSSIPVLAGLYRLALGDRYQEYIEFCDLRHGANGWRVVMALGWMLLLVSVVAMPQLLWSHASFYPNEIRLRKFTSFTEQRFDYTDVAQLAHVRRFQAPNGNWIERPHHVVEFNDGTLWTTRSVSDPNPAEDPQLMDFLVEKTGLPIQQLREWPEQ